MLTPCGPLDDCVTSMAVMLLTYSPSISMAGSGLAQGQGWGQLIKHLQAGSRTPGHTQVSQALIIFVIRGIEWTKFVLKLDTSLLCWIRILHWVEALFCKPSVKSSSNKNCIESLFSGYLSQFASHLVPQPDNAEYLIQRTGVTVEACMAG